MVLLARIVVALVLLALAGFCGFGFLATYEPPGSPLLRVAYGLIGLAGVGGAGWVLLKARGG